MSDVQKAIVIGSGPAGLTAALYLARANLAPVVYEGQQPGGQLTITSDVENFPGFPEGIQGPELMDLFRKQAQRFGAVSVFQTVTAVDFSQRPYSVTLENGDVVKSHAVIISTGSSAKWLGIEGETRLQGKGVSACATCDGFFFRDDKVVVVGGGDTALEEALFLTKFASEVTIVHRREELRASKIMQERALKHPKIDFEWNSVIVDLVGEDKVEGVKLRNVVTGEEKTREAGGYFAAIGHRHPKVVEAIRAQSGELLHAMGDLFPSRQKILLGEKLGMHAVASATCYENGETMGFCFDQNSNPQNPEVAGGIVNRRMPFREFVGSVRAYINS